MKGFTEIMEISISKSFNGFKVIENISFRVNPGEFVCVVGKSGCGKTTLLRIIAGLEEYEGEIKLDTERIGFVFQDDRLLPWKTALENVLFPIGIEKKIEKGDVELAKKILKLVGLEGFEGYYPKELSGGMRQRVGLARAIIIQPDILLMDEPFASLDELTRQKMQEELIQLWERDRKTVIFVTHSIDEAVFLATRIVVLTPRPSKVAGEVKIDLPRPRDRTSSEFNLYKRKVLNLLRLKSES
ncbi:MAG: ABC transporter ATP-binding protein [Archaeoglobus sp.]|nr:ABC transporter ATP-binding protein [Archaeoglobus sp.]